MTCNLIRDLIPLCIDGCGSADSRQAVESHIQNCEACRKIYEEMKAPMDAVTVNAAPKQFRKLQDWKASLLQSVLLFFSFGLITIGVALEASTPKSLMNGFWAWNLVIPATGLLLSLANWYFVRVYQSRKVFSTCSLICTLFITVCAYIWSVFHYEMDISILFSTESLLYNGMGIVLSAVFCVLSKVLSNQYAKLLGKE